jgi:hypothetical protein
VLTDGQDSNIFELNYSFDYLYPEDNICLLLLQGAKHEVKFLYEDEYSSCKGMLFQSYQLLLQITIFFRSFYGARWTELSDDKSHFVGVIGKW